MRWTEVSRCCQCVQGTFIRRFDSGARFHISDSNNDFRACEAFPTFSEETCSAVCLREALLGANLRASRSNKAVNWHITTATSSQKIDEAL